MRGRRAEPTSCSISAAGYAVAITAADVVVEAGRVLVRLDPRDYRAAVERAEAQVEQARASAEQARQRLDLRAEQIKVAEAALTSARAKARNAAIVLASGRDR